MRLLRADGVVEGDVGMAPAMRRRDHVNSSTRQQIPTHAPPPEGACRAVSDTAGPERLAHSAPPCLVLSCADGEVRGWTFAPITCSGCRTLRSRQDAATPVLASAPGGRGGGRDGARAASRRRPLARAASVLAGVERAQDERRAAALARSAASPLRARQRNRGALDRPRAAGALPRQASFLPDRGAHRAHARRARLREHPRRAGTLLRRHGDEETKMTLLGRLAALALLALAMPAGAAVLYKSVDSKGVIQFSDLPPPPAVEAKPLIVPAPSSAGPA